MKIFNVPFPTVIGDPLDPPLDPSVQFAINGVKGALLPRLTNAEMNAIVDPANGSIVYNLNLSQFCYFNGTQWEIISSGGAGYSGYSGISGYSGTTGLSAHPNKTLSYTGDRLTRIDEFTDSSKTILLNRRELVYTGEYLTSIVFKNALLETTSIKTLQYSSGILVGTTE